jgi:predicted nucleotidyltransferase
MEPIVKIAREVGTSAGVLLPRSLLGAKVKVTVIEEAPNPLMDSLKILEENGLNSSVLGIYLTGSYARKEATLESDVDILVITGNITKNISEGRYSLTLVSLKDLEKGLEDNSISYYPMIFEAEVLINGALIEKYKKINLSKSNLGGYLKSTREMIEKIEKMIDLDNKLGNKNTNDHVAYSLVLRLKGFYILKKILQGKKWSNREFLKKIDGLIYDRYLNVKRNDKYLNKTPIVDAEKMLNVLKKEVKEW